LVLAQGEFLDDQECVDYQLHEQLFFLQLVLEFFVGLQQVVDDFQGFFHAEANV
jgi:hypothetical protein